MPIYSEFVKSIQDLVHDAMIPDAEKGSDKPPPYKACKQEDAPDSCVSKAKAEQVWKCTADAWGNPCNMSLIFKSGERGMPDYWLGQMYVKADDIPKLMRNGLSCQESNINREVGWIGKGNWTGHTQGATTMPLLRMIELRDTSEEGKWSAFLLIGANKMATLSNFRITDLGQDTCTRATACTNHGTVYGFDAQNPAANFNAIYDDMPLTGLWPWPKKKENEKGQEEEQSLLDTRASSTHPIRSESEVYSE